MNIEKVTILKNKLNSMQKKRLYAYPSLISLMSYEPIQQVYSCELELYSSSSLSSSYSFDSINIDPSTFAKCIATPCEIEESFILPKIKTNKRFYLELANKNEYYSERYNKWLLRLRKKNYL